MAKPKKKVIETHGKVDSDKFQPMLLEQVWGVDNLAKYGTMDRVVYSKRIDGMTRADLEAHARQMGVVIVEHSPQLKEKLMREFDSYVSLLRKPLDSPRTPTTPSEAALKVLAEGR